MDTEATGLTIMCRDKGMAAQISRHIQGSRVRRSYRFLCQQHKDPESTPCPQDSATATYPAWLLDHLRINDYESPASSSDIIKDVQLVDIVKGRSSEIRSLLSHQNLSVLSTPSGWKCMQLFKLSFPDPMTPSGQEFEIEVEMPAEWIPTGAPVVVP